jgi:histidinol-phosphate/aromatic aminotransferase/cobyric acid decarboxylase-like protein
VDALNAADYEALARELGFKPLPSATNFVAIDVGALGLNVAEAHKRTATAGVLVGDLAGGRLGTATYLGITDDDIEQAIAAIARALVGRPISVAERSSP